MARKWKIETISNGEILYRHVHPNHFNHKKQRIRLTFFGNLHHPKNEFDPDISCNWLKYCDADGTRRRSPNPDIYGVVEIGTDLAFALNQEVVHAPIQDDPTQPDNQSHSNIRGDRTDLDIQQRFVSGTSVVMAPKKPEP